MDNYTKEKGLGAKELGPQVLSLADKAGKEGFKRADAYEAISHLLPARKTDEQKIRFVGDMLRNMAKDGKLVTDGKRWYCPSNNDEK